MDAQQISAIQASFDRLQASGTDYTSEFYKRVFEIAPQAASLFKDDMAEQRKALHATLAMVVNGLDKFSQLESAIFNLGQRHIQYGVVPDHFPIVARALLETLEACVPNITAAEQEAWATGLTAIADVMIRAWDEQDQAV